MKPLSGNSQNESSMTDDPNVIRCPGCKTVLSFRKGNAGPIASFLRKDMPRLDCTGCGKAFKADPFEAGGGGLLVEVTE